MISHSFPSYDKNVIDKAYEALQNGEFSRRGITLEAEKRFAQFASTKYSKLMSSGFVALQSALIAIGVTDKKVVTIPNITCPSVYYAIKSIGAIPHVIDVDNEYPILSTKSLLEQSLTEYIIVPNMFGIKANIDKVKFPNVKFIVDNAQSFSKQNETWADIGVYSFSPTKMVTIGYAGAIVTNINEIYNRVTTFLDVEHSVMENNKKLKETLPFRIHSDVSDFQSAMLIEQIKRYDEIIKYRGELSQIYDKYFEKSRLLSNVPFRYQIILDKPNASKIGELLQKEGITVVPLGSHLLSDLFEIEGNFDNSKWWKEHILSIPLHESISFEQAESISRKICKVIE
ncbi:DegT/DnrJ/EryC1/StrS family aminotransferase [Lysinibacillus sp. OL1_EC]|uniref:DegT/DnrJ/EryC1/StrS family aminotransferase n=1 Tax=unclassified Lysinibacillus TaxID=2636778 RepID=UPI00187D3DFF|nr:MULTISPECIES: DegT/DnrJ/EryC1/StrS family aminotransferase [unclassified Lysinibacillus]MCM0626385.1 DegT/DnrJ/EryC1/StrS family aminotransferase [Lysinibacillus sp. OL1_EC]